MEHPPPLVLASGSPRRRELLASLGVTFEVRPADVDETVRPGESSVDLVRRLALDKAQAGLDRAPEADLVVLGADTVVVLDGEVLGKPGGPADARRMLRALSGRSHQVLTGVAVASRRTPAGRTAEDVTLAPAVDVAVEVEAAQVTFAGLTDDDIDAYVATGEPMDKAGSYGIQGGAGRFVVSLLGDRDAVIGLPLDVTRRLLVEAGVDLAPHRAQPKTCSNPPMPSDVESPGARWPT